MTSILLELASAGLNTFTMFCLSTVNHFFIYIYKTVFYSLLAFCEMGEDSCFAISRASVGGWIRDFCFVLLRRSCNWKQY